jgi:putative nucleotidyltransferase with HDIG domain
MKIDSTFLRSKVARRIFFQFILCALFPIVILAFFSLGQVTSQLQKESAARLLQATRSEGMSIYERLNLLEAEMKVISGGVRANSTPSPVVGASELPPELKSGFVGVEQVESSGTSRTLFGTISQPPELTPAEAAWVQAGHSAVSIRNAADHPRIFMTRLADPRRPQGGRLVAEVNAEYVWGVPALPAHVDLCVLGTTDEVLFCSNRNLLAAGRRPPPNLASQLPQLLGRRTDDSYVTSHWDIFLKPQFSAGRWTVVLGEPQSDAVALLAPFERSFPQVILLSIWLVTLLSLVQIRRNLVPLERLKEAAEQMSGFKFGAPVNVTSGDEFEDLAHTFNDMGDRLSRQFQALESINQIDRAILSSLDTRRIVSTVLDRLRQIVPFECVSISLVDSKGADQLTTFLNCSGEETGGQARTGCLSAAELSWLFQNPEGALLDASTDPSGFVAPLAERGMKAFLVLPLIHQGKLLGIISLGHGFLPDLSDEQIFQARQVADQVTVALSNASLIQELANLHIGTLTALARAIDAKSAWTSGHSERVTELAVCIARAMGLPPKELEILRRGGLLHDIGKIGTPAAILDKPAKLTPEEYQLMRQHVRIGARILEPIPGLQDVIPIVLQHHEWYDGTGYPSGIAGDAISLHARIFALADCYDALSSERPYRPGLGRAQVVELIRKETGTHFDPQVVQAFYRVLAEQDSIRELGEGVLAGPAAEGQALR